MGIGLLVAGLLVVRLARRALRSDGAHDNSGPTRLTVGMTCLFVGYHAVVWSVPAGWSALAVPLDRWWIVVGIGVLALLGAVLGEWLEGRE